MPFIMLLGLGTAAAAFFLLQGYKRSRKVKEEENKKYEQRQENNRLENQKHYRNISLERYKHYLNVLLEDHKFILNIILAILTVPLTVFGYILWENYKKYLNKSDSQPISAIVAKTPSKSWIPDSLHPKYSNVIASKTEGKWVAAPGYKLLRPDTSDLKVIWESGQTHPIHPNVIASKKEKIWIPARGYKFVTGDDNSDLRVQPE
ncbi:hypothetical protein [Nostoc sp. WHI]|uniref:hypothetical protein n=1 Tax=Nostoc sp. WHI TaxID=2650611 RepID=UPI0018C524BE|nr:hypothetical protein [Nostoc sp. WHI]MBG1266038.1 hypothetical protein [Nostoc sp. WHI]